MSDVLLDLMLTELKRQDSIDKVKRYTNFDDANKHNIQCYENFIKSLGIPGFEFYVGRNSKVLKCRPLTGPETLKVFKNIKIQLLLPNLPFSTVGKIQHLWDELLEINMFLSLPSESLSTQIITDFGEQAKKWGRDFIDIYHTSAVTPYIHALTNHAVEQFMRIHGSTLPFTQQGLEKLITKTFFRSSCHWEEALKQIIEKKSN